MANLDQEQFDVMKAELLSIYDQLKSLKRDTEVRNRDFTFDVSYVQRNEQTIDSLESRKNDLSASVENKAKKRLDISESSLEQFEVEFDSLSKQLDDKKFEFGGYDLTYSQNTFVTTVSDYADAIINEFSKINNEFNLNYTNSAMTDKYEDKDAKFEKQINKMYNKFYDESNELRKSKESKVAEKEALQTALEKAEDDVKAELQDLLAQIAAAEASGDNDLVKKLSAQVDEVKDSHDKFRKVEQRKIEKLNIDISYLTDKLAELDAEVEQLVQEVREGIADGRKLSGEVPTIEQIYAIGVEQFDSGVDLKDADAEVRALKTDLQSFDEAAAADTELFEKEFKEALSQLGIEQAKIVKVEDDLKRLPDVIAEANDLLTQIQADIVLYDTDLTKLYNDLKSNKEASAAKAAEIAGFPVDVDPDTLAKAESELAKINAEIAAIETEISDKESKKANANKSLDENQAIKAEAEAALVDAQAEEPQLKANYDALKAAFDDKNVQRAAEVATKATQREAKVSAIVAAEEAQFVVDSFKSRFNLNPPQS